MKVNSIAEQLFFTTVRIETRSLGGAGGSGTGFLFTYKAGGEEYPFIVTNKHVVMDACDGAIFFTKRGKLLPLVGEGFRLDMHGWPQMWFGHPSPEVDIAICPFAPLIQHIKSSQNIDVFYKSITDDILINEQEMEQIDAIESITFIGYPNGIWDKKNLLPIARRGTTATPIQVDFEGSPCFLIDASVFGGSSGSPVFILNQGSYHAKLGGLVAGSRILFVGVIASVFFRTQMSQIIAVPIPTQMQPMAQHQEMIDLGLVFKARTVVEAKKAFLLVH